MSDPAFHLFSFSVALAAGVGVAAGGCVLPPPAPPPLPVLAEVPYPFRLAVDATKVYVSHQTPAPLLAIPVNGDVASPVGVQAAGPIAVDEQRLYWSDGSAVFSCDKSNCAGTAISLAADAASDIALDADNVYWSTSNTAGPGHVMKAAKAGGAPVMIAAVGSPGGLAVDAQDVYWIDADLVKAPITEASATPMVVVDESSAGALALDANNVYLRTNDGRLLKAPKNGGPDQVLLTDLGAYPGPVATDGTTVYVASDHNVVEMAVGGGRVTVMTPGLTLPSAIVMDQTSLYVADVGGGLIAKLAR